MKKRYSMILLALFLALVAGNADARPKKTRGGSGTPTNYGCSTLSAGTVLVSPDGLSQKSLLTATWCCYLFQGTTNNCEIQSPDTLFGWWFVY